MANLSTPRATTRAAVSQTHSPSIKQFLSCRSMANFNHLNGEEDQEKIGNKIREKPVLFWTHPSIFDILEGNRELLGMDSGSRVIRSLPKKCREAAIYCRLKRE
jgi:hypothetical protein